MSCAYKVLLIMLLVRLCFAYLMGIKDDYCRYFAYVTISMAMNMMYGMRLKEELSTVRFLADAAGIM